MERALLLAIQLINLNITQFNLENNMNITQPSVPKNEDFKVLKFGLNCYNESIVGKLDKEKVASFVEDKSGDIRGGILGEIKWGWLYVEGLWIDSSCRKKGWGAKLLSTLEKYAQSKGVVNYRLETTSFQALGFYQKAGYCVFAELPDMPPGHTSYFLKKRSGS